MLYRRLHKRLYSRLHKRLYNRLRRRLLYGLRTGLQSLHLATGPCDSLDIPAILRSSEAATEPLPAVAPLINGSQRIWREVLLPQLYTDFLHNGHISTGFSHIAAAVCKYISSAFTREYNGVLNTR